MMINSFRQLINNCLRLQAKFQVKLSGGKKYYIIIPFRLQQAKIKQKRAPEGALLLFRFIF